MTLQPSLPVLASTGQSAGTDTSDDCQGVDELIDGLSDSVTKSLWRLNRGEPDPSHLSFPKLRNTKNRVSEQESKILVTQWLWDEGHWYSIETPTTKTFRFSPSEQLENPSYESALADVTVHRPGLVKEKLLNIELKAHQPPTESFRKDLEKLIREDVPGLRFHTLRGASLRSWSTLEGKLREALTRLEKVEACAPAFREGRGSVHFVFCVLNSEAVRKVDLTLGTWKADLGSGFSEPVQ